MIDGHNLIPKIPGLNLAVADDEMQLVELLQEFCRLRRKQAEIYFDNAPPGQPRVRTYGLVTARFIRTGQTADAAIRAHLTRLGAEARNWTVVSSDQAVQSAARAAQAQYLSSEAFAGLLKQALDDSARDEGEKADIQLDNDELDEWIRLFGKGANTE